MTDLILPAAARAAPAIFATDDHMRLRALAAQTRGTLGAGLLARRLESARVVDPSAMPRNVARLYSWVAYHDDGIGRKRQGRLVPPREADVYARHISVCSPIGAALIGLEEGASIDWPDQYGGLRRLTLLLVDPPEA